MLIRVAKKLFALGYFTQLRVHFLQNITTLELVLISGLSLSQNSSIRNTNNSLSQQHRDRVNIIHFVLFSNKAPTPMIYHNL